MVARPAAGLWPALLCALLLGTACLAPAPPRVSVAIDPRVLDTNSRATAQVTPEETVQDDLVLTYQWLRNGAPIAGATSAFLDLSLDARGARGDTITVEVVAQRGRARGTPTRSPVATVEPVVTVDVRESASYYRVEGRDSASLFASIRANAPRDGNTVAYGQARFSSAPLEFRAVRGDAGCAIDTLELRNDVLVVLPGPVTPPLPPALQAKYDRFRTAIEVHEARHVTIRRVHLEALGATLRAVPPVPTCEALNAQVDRIIRDALVLEDAEQDRFHEEDGARVQAACSPIEAEIAALSAALGAARGQPARYNALIPRYNELIDDHNWCVKS
jgi:predicted secreted Zn-dependent protease